MEAVEGYESVKEGLAKIRDDVSAHRDEETGVRPHHSTGRTARDRDAITSQPSQSSVLPLKRVICMVKKI